MHLSGFNLLATGSEQSETLSIGSMRLIPVLGQVWEPKPPAGRNSKHLLTLLKAVSSRMLYSQQCQSPQLPHLHFCYPRFPVASAHRGRRTALPFLPTLRAAH